MKATYVAANLIVKKSKPFIDSKFIKPYMESIADIICPDLKNKKIKKSNNNNTNRFF